MQSNPDILNELKAISSLLAGLEKQHVYTVPRGYFESLPGIMLSAVKEEESGVIDQLAKSNTASVPEGYFEGLADSILGRIRAQQHESAADELRTLSPMLYSIQGSNVYEVPAGYFNGLTDAIVTRIRPVKAKLVVMRRRSAVFMKYAVAAAFTGVMALGVFKFTSTPNIAAGESAAWTMNVDKELDNVPDVDIIKYLETNGENVDAMTVASKALDENELPSQADYLNDDKALDKYLDNISTDDLKN